MVDSLPTSMPLRPSDMPTGTPLRGRQVCCLIQTDTLARNSRLIKVAEAAAAAGAETTVLYAWHSSGCEEPEGPFKVMRVATRVPSEHPLRLIRVATNVLRETVVNPWLIARAATKQRADLYHAHFLPMLLPAYLAARWNRAALVYDVRDLYLDAGYLSLPRWRKRYLGWIERYLVGKTQAVLAVGAPMAAVLEQRYRLENVHVVLNGPYECSTQALPVSSPIKMLFQGAFRHNRNLANLVRAMDSLRGAAELTLQGWGDLEGELRELVDSLGLQGTVHFREPCEPRDVVQCAQEYDVGVICYRSDTLNLEISTPNKLFDYIGAGLAVAASDLPGLRSVVEPAGCGVLIDPRSHETMARDFVTLLRSPERVTRMKIAAVRACPAVSWAQQSKKLIEIYSDVISACG